MYSITSESAAHPDIVSLIAALDAYQSELYPAESNHLLDLTQLSTDSLIMMVIRDRQLKAVGCGAIVLNGDGTGANILGLTNQTGVQVLDAAAFTADPVADTGSANENFNRILRARVNIRSTGRARANFVVVNPADSETFLTATNTSGDYYGAGPFSGNGTANLWGMRVVEDENQDAGVALVGDGRMAAVWDRMQAQILIDTINDQFVRNMLTILAEERLALTVFRPQAFALVTLA